MICDKYIIYIDKMHLGEVKFSESEGGLYTATFLFFEEKRTLKAAGNSGGNTLQKEHFTGFSEDEVLSKVVVFAANQFGGGDVEFKEVK